MSPPDQFIWAPEASQALHLDVAPRFPAAAHQKGALYASAEWGAIA